MPTDQLVHHRDVLAAVQQLRHRSRRHILCELEQLEPDLTEHLLEELSATHKRLHNSALTARQVRHIYRRVETLTLVSLLALRHATLRLWQDQLGAEAPDDPGESKKPDDSGSSGSGPDEPFEP